MSDTVGKFAKELGRLHPSSMRRIDREPPKVTPKIVHRPKGLKRYSFETYEKRMKRVNGKYEFVLEWRRWWHWYATPEQRDQAMGAVHRYYASPIRETPPTRPVERH